MAQGQAMIIKSKLYLLISVLALSKKLVLGNFHTSVSTSLFYDPHFLSHNVFYYISETTSNAAITKSSQSCGIILFQAAHEFSICFTKGECIPYEVTAFLNLFKSNISSGSELISA